MSTSDGSTALFEVVVNEEEQYSIWPHDQAIPAGWKKVGQQGPKEACLAYINEVWTDLRPLSLKVQMAAALAAAPSQLKK